MGEVVQATAADKQCAQDELIRISHERRSRLNDNRRLRLCRKTQNAKRRTQNAETQSIFCLAARREDAGTGRHGHRRDGGLRMGWAKPLRRCAPMGIASSVG